MYFNVIFGVLSWFILDEFAKKNSNTMEKHMPSLVRVGLIFLYVFCIFKVKRIRELHLELLIMRIIIFIRMGLNIDMIFSELLQRVTIIKHIVLN